MSRKASASTGGLHRGGQGQGRASQPAWRASAMQAAWPKRAALPCNPPHELMRLPAVNGLARAVEDTAKHVARHGGRQHLRENPCQFVRMSQLRLKTAMSPQASYHLGARAGACCCCCNRSPPPRTSPVNSREVFLLSIPDVPSNTCTTARVPSTSSTWPRRRVPSPSLISTISAYFGFCSHRMHRSRGCTFVQSIYFVTQRCGNLRHAPCRWGPKGRTSTAQPPPPGHRRGIQAVGIHLDHLHHHQRTSDTSNGAVLCATRMGLAGHAWVGARRQLHPFHDRNYATRSAHQCGARRCSHAALH